MQNKNDKKLRQIKAFRIKWCLEFQQFIELKSWVLKDERFFTTQVTHNNKLGQLALDFSRNRTSSENPKIESLFEENNWPRHIIINTLCWAANTTKVCRMAMYLLLIIHVVFFFYFTFIWIFNNIIMVFLWIYNHCSTLKKCAEDQKKNK